MNWIFYLTALLGGLLAATSETNGVLGNSLHLEEERSILEAGLQENYKTCSAGQYRTPDKICVDCPAGTYVNNNCREEKKNKCRPCGKGKVSPVKSAVCTRCSAGTYADHETNKCVSCPVNTYSRGQAELCMPCPLDQYSALGEAKCRKCTKGFKVNADRTGCQEIRPGGIPSTLAPTKRPVNPPISITLTSSPTFALSSTPTFAPTPLIVVENSPTFPPTSAYPTLFPTPLAIPAPTFAPTPLAIPAPTFAPTPLAIPAPTFAPTPLVVVENPPTFAPSPSFRRSR